MQSLMNIGILAQVKTKNHVVKIISEKPNTSLLCTQKILRKGIKKIYILRKGKSCNRLKKAF